MIITDDLRKSFCCRGEGCEAILSFVDILTVGILGPFMLMSPVTCRGSREGGLTIPGLCFSLSNSAKNSKTLLILTSKFTPILFLPHKTFYSDITWSLSSK